MKPSERKALIKWAKSLTDEELKNKYYKSIYDSLGRETEDMYELGYDMVNIKERINFEKDLCKISDILENLCLERSINLWE